MTSNSLIDAITPVPCGSCRACCQNFPAIFLFPSEGDDVYAYDTVEMLNPLTMEPGHMLKHKENGDCAHLGEKGCEIYDNRPVLCRAFDCRKNYLEWTKARRDSLPWVGVWEAAKKRLHTLTGKERLASIAKRKAAA